MRTHHKFGSGGAILCAFAAALLIKALVFDFMLIQGVSMTPTLDDGSVIVVNRLAYGFRFPFTGSYVVRWARPRPGDVVVFYTPYGDLAVKRCVRLVDEAARNTAGDDAAADVPADAFFARGDNAAESFDSRAYGPVPLDNIIGQALAR